MANLYHRLRQQQDQMLAHLIVELQQLVLLQVPLRQESL
jgi:hypothetical protein